jgi:hypothetical protein
MGVFASAWARPRRSESGVASRSTRNYAADGALRHGCGRARIWRALLVNGNWNSRLGRADRAAGGILTENPSRLSESARGDACGHSEKARKEFITLKSAYAHHASAEGSGDTEESVAQFRRCGLCSRAASEAPMRLLLLTLVVLAGLIIVQAYRNECFWHGSDRAIQYVQCVSKF